VTAALAWPTAPTGELTAQVAVATPSPEPSRGELDPNDVSPGLLGFVVMFAIVLVCIPLFRSMTGKIRRIEHSAGGSGDDAAPSSAELAPGDS